MSERQELERLERLEREWERDERWWRRMTALIYLVFGSVLAGIAYGGVMLFEILSPIEYLSGALSAIC